MLNRKKNQGLGDRPESPGNTEVGGAGGAGSLEEAAFRKIPALNRNGCIQTTQWMNLSTPKVSAKGGTQRKSFLV